MLEPVVLACIEHRRRYTAEIVADVRASGFPVQEGTLYPLLNRLRRDALVTHEWEESSSGPPRKYFTLTESGRAQLTEFRDYWRELTQILDTIGQ